MLKSSNRYVAVVVHGGLHHPIRMEAHLIFPVLLLFVQPQGARKLQMIGLGVLLVHLIELLHLRFQGVHIPLTQKAE